VIKLQFFAGIFYITGTSNSVSCQFIKKCPTASGLATINSNTGHCYVVSFGAGERLDVIITIMKRAMFCIMSPRT